MFTNNLLKKVKKIAILKCPLRGKGRRHIPGQELWRYWVAQSSESLCSSDINAKCIQEHFLADLSPLTSNFQIVLYGVFSKRCSFSILHHREIFRLHIHQISDVCFFLSPVHLLPKHVKCLLSCDVIHFSAFTH